MKLVPLAGCALILAGHCARTQLQPFAKEADFERWAASRAELTDKVSILYVSWTCANDGSVWPKSVCLKQWRRAPEGEYLAAWPISEEMTTWLPPHPNAPCSWTADQRAALAQRAIDLAKAPPLSYACFQQGRYANWSYRARTGNWFGELTISGDAFSIRDQLHMALGLTYVGDWLVPIDRERFAMDLTIPNDVVLSSKDERIALTFDADRMVIRSRYFRKQAEAPKAFLQLREGPTGLGIDGPQVVSSPPRLAEYMFMHFCAVKYERLQSLPLTMLQKPPVEAKDDPPVASLVDRRLDTRAIEKLKEMQKAAHERREQAELEARRLRSGK